ncbi:MAG: ABC transporter substrate-binding protein [SAR324 cluster bacterium]|nr:ABC transporter substrate-binding protein [SAR324 cluster bacterium]
MIFKILQQALLAAFLLSPGPFSGFAETLPANIKWLSNNSSPIIASPNAKKGGTYRTYMTSFPLTLRTVGPDSNGGFASYLRSNQMSLIELHNNTEEIIPGLATHWAYGKDGKTMYFKLDQEARWSDGTPVTADDFLYTLEFHRSKHIVAPWYNNYYTEKIDRVIKYDDHTLAVVTTKADPDLFLVANIGPTPKHFYGELSKDFVRKYNWKVAPNTGPYQIDAKKIKKGKSITLERKKNWWAKDLRNNKGRYNVDKIQVSVVRDQTTVFEYFKKGRLDDFILTFPTYWHEKAKNLEIYEKGYAKKMWFYLDQRESPAGLYLNQDKEIFKDAKLRYAFAHAMNIDKMLNGLLRGDYSRLQNYSTGFGKYTNPKIRARTFDINKVEELMTESGWKRGSDGIWNKGESRYSVKVTYSFDGHTPRLVLLKEEAKKAGIELRLQRLDGSAAFKSFLEKKHDVAWMAWSTSFRPRYWQGFHSDNAHKPQTNNITNTDDPELDKMIMSYRDSIVPKERIALAHKIQEKIHEIGSFIPTYKVGYLRNIYWRWWQFPEVPATRDASFLFEPLANGLFWMDEELKKETEAAMNSGKTFKPETIIDKTFLVN